MNDDTDIIRGGNVFRDLGHPGADRKLAVGSAYEGNSGFLDVST